MTIRTVKMVFSVSAPGEANLGACSGGNGS
jgi:hypothetical protein